ncbi:U-box domain-containing protein 70 [Fusarium oxysporum f. sp. raphani]|uniref:U-box domain-containing protein 70 n=1 Tax=Fusarium oxysporum f. sp. raphani TaxID=96318 RepID=A0A8J5Q3V4_FUSOX|nr:U-box domain-containing protein 70 [Fusarium oxysporum f. sp. raphani]
MEMGGSSNFSQLLRETLEHENTSTERKNYTTDEAPHLNINEQKISGSSFEQHMYQLLSQNDTLLPLRPTQSQIEDLPIRKSLGVDASSLSATGPCDSENQSQQDKGNAKKGPRDAVKGDDLELEHYHDFLCQVSALGSLRCIAQSEIDKTRLSPYGAGASMTVYPGLWSKKKDDGSTTKDVVAIKYCNITAPQGASSLRDCRDQISSRLKSVLYELEVMSSRDTRHSDTFPEVYAMSWEDCQTPAGITIYQPILIVEPAIATLEEYICNGWPPSIVRHEAEKRFIVSLHSAMSYLHEHCGVVHGDLKPGNILIFLNRYSGEVHAKLSDFGLAFPIHDSEIRKARRENWRPLGTRYWSAPEMCFQDMSFGSMLTPYAADYYSFGLVVWFILFGYPVSESDQGIIKGDEDRFMAMKRSFETEVQDCFEQAFSRRWRWRVSESCIRFLKKVKDPEDRKKFMSVLIKVKQIQEQEWNEEKKTWTSTKSQLHHAYRGLVRRALSCSCDERIYPCALPTNLVFERSVAETLSANHVCGDLDYPDMDLGYSTYAARRRTEKQLGSDLYTRQSEQSKKMRTRLMTLGQSAIESIPEALGQELLEMLVLRASDETRPQEERVRDMKSIQNLAHRFPSDVDADHWERQMLELGPSIHRLKYVYEHSVLDEPVDGDLATSWVLDGLSSSLTEQVDDKVQGVLNGIRHDLAVRPAEIALTDWASEVGIRHPQCPTYPDIDQNPVFKSIIQGNLAELHHHLAKSKTRPLKLRYKHYNLLNFAIINRQPRICRYLCLEHNFEFSFANGGDEALEDCISDHLATILTEFDSFTAVLHERWRSTSRDIDKRPFNLVVQLLYPPVLAILAQRGTSTAMELVHSLVSNPLSINAHMMQLGWIEQFQGEDSVNPLMNSLVTRRFTPFLRLLQMGQPHRALFPPDSVITGLPILFHALDLLAPFFVAALLAYGADANTFVELESGLKVNALHVLCSQDGSETYKESLRRRLEFHEGCGFSEYIIERDRAEIDSAEEDAVSQRILIAELLISHNADINAKSIVDEVVGGNATYIFPETPLSLAIASGKVELACFLIQSGADLSTEINGKTPVFQAIDCNYVGIIKCLLDQAPLENSILEGLSPLSYATCMARLEIFKLLLERGSHLTFAPATGGILFYQILEMTSELCSEQEEIIFSLLSTSEDRRKLRPVLAEHLMKMAPEDLRVLMQSESENGAIGIHHAARWITGRNKGDAELLSIILSNTENLHSTLRTGQNAAVLGIALGNIGFLSAWNTAVLSRWSTE